MIPFLIAVALLSSGYYPCRAEGITPQMERWLVQGVDDIFRMRFDEAELAARKAIALNPEHPHAYLGLAEITWTRYVYETEQSDPSLLEPFERRVRQAAAAARAYLDKHPNDAEALMDEGAAYGI